MNTITPTSDAASPAPKRVKKILLVDDVKLFISLEKTFFQRKESFKVLTASSGKEALVLVESEQPDLVYMDLFMPEMNGDECCRRIKESDFGRDIPVVMVTSAGNAEDIARCEAAGCDEIVTKPINRGHFMSIARKYLEVHERKDPRYAIHVKVRFGDQDDLLTDYTVNLSSGGLFLTSPQPLPRHTLLDIEFSLPETGETINCKARIAWVNDTSNPTKPDLPAGMGLQFVDIAESEIRIIQSYIESNNLTAEW